MQQLRQQVEQGKPLRKVTPAELMDEIERQRQLLLGGAEAPAREGDGPTGDVPSGGTGGTGVSGGDAGGPGEEMEEGEAAASPR